MDGKQRKRREWERQWGEKDGVYMWRVHPAIDDKSIGGMRK